MYCLSEKISKTNFQVILKKGDSVPSPVLKTKIKWVAIIS